MAQELGRKLAERIATENWPETVKRLTLFASYRITMAARRRHNSPMAEDYVLLAIAAVLSGRETDDGRSLFAILCGSIRRQIAEDVECA